MRWAIASAAALTLLFVNLHAQQPGKSGHSTRVLTGCLRAGTASETFKLTDATPFVDAKDLAGPVGTSGEKTEYSLTADAGLERSGPPIDLKSHVGHQVEVTVRPVESLVAPPASSAAPTAGAKSAERTPARVTVIEIKSLSSSCS